MSKRRFFKAREVTLNPSIEQITSSYFPPTFILVPFGTRVQSLLPILRLLVWMDAF
jgi:hypothetical protein